MLLWMTEMLEKRNHLRIDWALKSLKSKYRRNLWSTPPILQLFLRTPANLISNRPFRMPLIQSLTTKKLRAWFNPMVLDPARVAASGTRKTWALLMNNRNQSWSRTRVKKKRRRKRRKPKPRRSERFWWTSLWWSRPSFRASSCPSRWDFTEFREATDTLCGFSPAKRKLWRFVSSSATEKMEMTWKFLPQHSPGFGAGFRSGSNMIWTPIQHAKTSR